MSKKGVKSFLSTKDLAALHGVSIDQVAQQCDVGYLTAYSLKTGKAVLAPQQCHCQHRFENELHFQIIPPPNGFFLSVSTSILEFCDFDVRLSTGQMQWNDWEISKEAYEELPPLLQQGRVLFETEARSISMYTCMHKKYGKHFFLVHHSPLGDINNKSKIILADKIIFKIKNFSENINTSFLCVYKDGNKRFIKEHKISIVIEMPKKYGPQRYFIKDSSENILFNYDVLASALCTAEYGKTQCKEYTKSMFYLYQHYLDVYSDNDRTRRLTHGDDFFYFNYEMYKNLLFPLVGESIARDSYYAKLAEFHFKSTDFTELFEFVRKRDSIVQDPKKFMLEELKVLIREHPSLDCIVYYKLVIEGNTGEAAYRHIHKQGKRGTAAGSEARVIATRKCKKFSDNAHKYKLPAISAQRFKNMDHTTRNEIIAEMLTQMHALYGMPDKEEWV